MSTPPMWCPGAGVGGWCDSVESVHGVVYGGRCVWLYGEVGGKSLDDLDGVGDDVPGARG